MQLKDWTILESLIESTMKLFELLDSLSLTKYTKFIQSRESTHSHETDEWK